MASMKFTEDQQKVIDLRNRNLLVSAAAGSGKTAVLVERILNLVAEGIDIDTLLVVTYTEAAAAEMRERISNLLRDRLAMNPQDKHLQKQAILIHNAQIATIHGFCLQMLKNHFQDVDLQPGFRVADDDEIKLMKHDVMEALLETYYDSRDERFLQFAERYASIGDTAKISEMILKISEDASSHAFVSEYLLSCTDNLHYETVEDMESAPWMQEIRNYETSILNYAISLIDRAIQLAGESEGTKAYISSLKDDRYNLSELLQEPSYQKRNARINCWKYAELARVKKTEADEPIKDRVKKFRDHMKSLVSYLKKHFYMDTPQNILKYQNLSGDTIEIAVELAREFQEAFAKEKREKNVIDFSDMEHFALKLLVRRENGAVSTTDVAKEYRAYFYEVMTDEYQDSNEVQEMILWAVSGEEEYRYNRFMVGDVKQSIYRFRLAKPEIFMHKYNTYSKEDNLTQKIVLSKNFRSRKEVLDSVNYVFQRVMAKDVGSVDYEEDARLYLGTEYKEQSGANHNTELLILNKSTEGVNEEATMIAEKIQAMVGKTLITDKTTGELRPAQYKDIVILLRTASGVDEVFKKVLEKCAVPAFIASRNGYFATWEISLLLNYITLLVNPRQDIPLLGVLHSFLGGLSEEEIAIVRASGNKRCLLIDSLRTYATTKTENTIADKISLLLSDLHRYRELSTYMSVSELLQTIIHEKHVVEYLCAMQGGEQRCANVSMLQGYARKFESTSYSGLFDFIRYMDLLHKREVDYGEANIADEKADVVRIMTIHKSKGLEFPICIVAMLGKQFNTQGEKSDFLTDSDMGIGNKYIDLDKRFQVDTLCRNAIICKQKTENRGEDFRILYVAMTRAREKLILTGRVKDLEKVMQAAVDSVNLRDEVLTYSEKIKAEGFMNILLSALAKQPEFIELAKKLQIKVGYAADETEESTKFLFTCVDVEDLQEAQDTQMLTKEVLRKKLMCHQNAEENVRMWKERFHFSYPHENLSELYTKTSVSELKHAAMEEEDEEAYQLFSNDENLPYIPAFMKDQEEAAGTLRGTAYHRVMELLDFTKLPEHITGTTVHDFYLQQIEQMLSEERISAQLQNLVASTKIELFLKSEIAARMAKAQRLKCLYREQPFVLGVPASMLKEEFPKEETLLIQGVIDVYFEEEGELVLLDYKTDRVKNNEELVKRYKTQLNYYELALTQLTGKKVKQKLIYSFALTQTIEIK